MKDGNNTLRIRVEEVYAQTNKTQPNRVKFKSGMIWGEYRNDESAKNKNNRKAK